MAIIYTYPKLETPDVLDLLLVTDVTDSNKTKQTTVKGIGDAIDVVDSITSLEPISVSSSTGDVEISLTGINGFGAAGQVLAVNQAEDALEYVTGGGGGVSLQKNTADIVNPANTINYQNGVKVEQDSASATTANINIVYESTLDTTSIDPVIIDKVGGFLPNTLLSEINENTNSLMWDTLLFPTVDPKYSVSNITLNTLPTTVSEIGANLSINLGYSAVKNDAGSYTGLQLYKSINNNTASLIDDNPNPIGNTFNNGLMQAFDPGVGGASPNRDNKMYSANAVDSFTMPVPVSGSDFSSVKFQARGTYIAGLPKDDSKGSEDSRSPGFSINTPQAARTSANPLNSVQRPINGYYPYYFGYALTFQDADDVAAAITAFDPSNNPINLTKIINTGNVAGNGIQMQMLDDGVGYFRYFAFYEEVPEKTNWFVQSLNAGTIGPAGRFSSPVIKQVSSNVLDSNGNPIWQNINFKIYISTSAFGISQATPVLGVIQIRQ